MWKNSPRARLLGVGMGAPRGSVTAVPPLGVLRHQSIHVTAVWFTAANGTAMIKTWAQSNKEDTALCLGDTERMNNIPQHCYNFNY